VRRRSYLFVAFGAFVIALAVILWGAVTLRQSGTSVTGSVTLNRAQQIRQLLTEAEADTALANDTAALSAYQQVLRLDPANVTALTQSGWLDWSAGSSAQNATATKQGITYLSLALSLAPRDPAPRLYYAIVAASTPGNAALAKTQFQIFLSLNPTSTQLAVAAPFLTRYGLTG